MKPGDHYGIHRSIEPPNTLPQPAWRIDPSLPIYDNELLLDVTTLNIDAASFQQIKREVGGTKEAVATRILQIVHERGKMHNPVTGSGGMLIGKIRQWGERFPHSELQIGQEVATLVSLSLTPLSIHQIHDICMETGQVEVEGEAILFASGIFAPIPQELPRRVALAVLDVCGAPGQIAKLVQPEQRVVILGAGGKSGVLSLFQARKQLGNTGQLLALEYSAEACDWLRQLHIADEVIQVDATQPVEVLKQVEAATAGELADLVINCVSMPHTEMAAILSTRQGGITYFFSMATSFTAAALGAEGVGKDIQMVIGNGYTAGHVQAAFEAIWEHPQIAAWFYQRYAGISIEAEKERME
ncbi:L-erythro-3,5-diaminohexanoate dehydrogenase [Rubeoparvulum massiliense]|uniref:L-erythro-3,5-diaminohexanoate dehydrogenase n=1 Tax=Rubeoparvulum massiliense TaxID=1631346 RepID=UPI00065E85A2|nr:L-erythro-3,5-diaminohexanoate dehydrogenase [Rubeoparvulum massiliense]